MHYIPQRYIDHVFTVLVFVFGLWTDGLLSVKKNFCRLVCAKYDERKEILSDQSVCFFGKYQLKLLHSFIQFIIKNTLRTLSEDYAIGKSLRSQQPAL